MKLKVTLLITLSLSFACMAMDYKDGSDDDGSNDYDKVVQRPKTPVFSAEINVCIPVVNGDIHTQRFETVYVQVARDLTIGQLEGLLMAATNNPSPISLFLEGRPLHDRSETLIAIFKADNIIEQNIGKIIGTFQKDRTTDEIYLPD